MALPQIQIIQSFGEAMNLVEKFSQYFNSTPIPDINSEGFQKFVVSERDLTLVVSVNEAESLVDINISSSAQGEPVFSTLQRNISEVEIRTDSRGREFLWFRSETNAVFLFKSPIYVAMKG